VSLNITSGKCSLPCLRNIGINSFWSWISMKQIGLRKQTLVSAKASNGEWTSSIAYKTLIHLWETWGLSKWHLTISMTYKKHTRINFVAYRASTFSYYRLASETEKKERSTCVYKAFETNESNPESQARVRWLLFHSIRLSSGRQWQFSLEKPERILEKSADAIQGSHKSSWKIRSRAYSDFKRFNDGLGQKSTFNQKQSPAQSKRYLPYRGIFFSIPPSVSFEVFARSLHPMQLRKIWTGERQFKFTFSIFK